MNYDWYHYLLLALLATASISLCACSIAVFIGMKDRKHHWHKDDIWTNGPGRFT